ncbi:hypothetical protein ACJ73_10371, partial [Blastomyces percursus]
LLYVGTPSMPDRLRLPPDDLKLAWDVLLLQEIVWHIGVIRPSHSTCWPSLVWIIDYVHGRILPRQIGTHRPSHADETCTRQASVGGVLRWTVWLHSPRVAVRTDTLGGHVATASGQTMAAAAPCMADQNPQYDMGAKEANKQSSHTHRTQVTKVCLLLIRSSFWRTELSMIQLNWTTALPLLPVRGVASLVLPPRLTAPVPPGRLVRPAIGQHGML